MQPKIFTFYSYKGGVGRSMALANIAELLYRQGKSVVVVDWDLEAPGLEGYFYNTKKELDRIIAQPGLIDMLESYKVTYPRLKASMSVSAGAEVIDNSGNIIEDSIRSLLKIIPVSRDGIRPEEVKTLLENVQEYDLQDEYVERITAELNKYSSQKAFESYIIIDLLKKILKKTSFNRQEDLGIDKLSENLPSISPLLHTIRKSLEAGSTAGLWFLSAGRRNAENFSTYAKTVQDFDWSEFYAIYDGEVYFNWLRKELQDFAEIILIDSRTGVTEMGGVCTRQLSDTVVLLTPPNAQNVSGISEMVKSLKRTDVEIARGRPLDVMVIPSRIDNSELRDLNNFHSEFLSQIGEITGEKIAAQFWELAIPYVPYYTYHEELVAGASMLNSDNLKVSKKSAQLEKAYLRIASFMLNAKFAPQPEKEPVNPYIGLRPFSEVDSLFFYGRSQEISLIIDTVAQNKMLILSGPPGSGKTSIIKAGVIPAIKANPQREKLRIIFIRPGNNVFYNIAVALLNELGEQNQTLDLNITAKELAESIANQYHKFSAVLESFFTSHNQSFLLIIDQLEELFTSNDEITVQILISTLIRWQKVSQKFSTILSVRSDCLPQLMAIFSSIEAREPFLINLGVLNKNELRQVITEPATKAGLNFEDGLLERILKDSEKLFLKLPLIQNVLYQLWLKKSGNILTHEAYDQLGQMEGIMQDIISKNIRTISTKDLELAKPIITRLVNVQTKSRSSANSQDFSTEEILKLKPFIDAGLVTITSNIKNQVETIQLSHDSLIGNWPILNEWMNEDQEFLIWRQRLDGYIEDWKKKYKSSRYLFRDYLLDEATEWMDRRPNELSNKEKVFIEESQKAKTYFDNQSIKKERRKVIMRQTYGILGPLLIISMTLIGYHYKRNQILKQFNLVLTGLDTKIGKDKRNAVCELATFNNTYDDESIRQTKDVLLSQCIQMEAVFNNTQEIIDSNEKKIDTLSAKTLIPANIITSRNSQIIDSLERNLNNTTMQIRYTKDNSQKGKLKEDSIKYISEINSILKNDTLLSKANEVSNKIETAIKTQNDILSMNNDDILFQQSSWFKKNYFLQFENIKILLLDIYKSNQTITIQICDMIGPTICKKPIINPNPTITLDNAMTFNYGGYKYVLNLDRIGSAGKNPFTPAAYITFLKYQND